LLLKKGNNTAKILGLYFFIPEVEICYFCWYRYL